MQRFHDISPHYLQIDCWQHPRHEKAEIINKNVCYKQNNQPTQIKQTFLTSRIGLQICICQLKISQQTKNKNKTVVQYGESGMGGRLKFESFGFGISAKSSAS